MGSGGALGPYLDQSSLWAPAYLPESAWIEHAPFAFWLVGAHRPHTIVELGVDRGFSYFVFCEAVERHGTDTRCFGVDSWEGDIHAGSRGADVYEEVSAHNRRYARFSRLIKSSFDAAVETLEDGSIDLLHVDGRHFYEDARHDFDTWRPKLSDRAIVLFHDTTERERGFGVWRVLEALRREFPVFEFSHGHGLGVVGVGNRLPTAIGALFDAPTDVCRAYAALGALLSYQRLERELAASDMTLARLVRSRSWRWTAPARRVVRAVRSVARSGRRTEPG